MTRSAFRSKQPKDPANAGREMFAVCAALSLVKQSEAATAVLDAWHEAMIMSDAGCGNDVYLCEMQFHSIGLE